MKITIFIIAFFISWAVRSISHNECLYRLPRNFLILPDYLLDWKIRFAKKIWSVSHEKKSPNLPLLTVLEKTHSEVEEKCFVLHEFRAKKNLRGWHNSIKNCFFFFSLFFSHLAWGFSHFRVVSSFVAASLSRNHWKQQQRKIECVTGRVGFMKLWTNNFPEVTVFEYKSHTLSL